MILHEAVLSAFCQLGGGVVLNYHTLSERDTRLHVEYLARFFDFISHDDLMLRLGASGRRPFCLLTFDDGKKSNATETAPMLRRLGVPAAFFVPTGFLSAGNRPLWFDRVAALEQHVTDLPVQLHGSSLKALHFLTLNELVDAACRKHGVDADMTSDDVRPMSWDDARALRAQGFTIGAHSEWHAILPRETVADAQADIRASMDRLATELRSPCVTFCFPNGNYTRPLARHAQACGAETVFTTEPMWAGPASQSWRLPRIQLFGGRDISYLGAKISAARIPGILTNPDGTGRRYVRLKASAASDVAVAR
jgi:peptidoglycan/xylan/chitin deacetylase (PgdA/CDA1 family)